MDGGIESGFRKVTKDKFESKLLHVTKQGPSMKVNQVPLSMESMCTDDCFILDTGSKIYVYHGEHASCAQPTFPLVPFFLFTPLSPVLRHQFVGLPIEFVSTTVFILGGLSTKGVLPCCYLLLCCCFCSAAAGCLRCSPRWGCDHDDCSPFEKNKSTSKGEEMESERGKDAERVDVDDTFWEILGGKPEEVKHSSEKVSSDPVTHAPVLYSLEDSKWHKEKDGTLSYDDVKDDDVMCIDIGTCLFVMVGTTAPPEEQRDCMIMAQKMLDENNLPHWTPIERVDVSKMRTTEDGTLVPSGSQGGERGREAGVVP